MNAEIYENIFLDNFILSSDKINKNLKKLEYSKIKKISKYDANIIITEINNRITNLISKIDGIINDNSKNILRNIDLKKINKFYKIVRNINHSKNIDFYKHFLNIEKKNLFLSFNPVKDIKIDNQHQKLSFIFSFNNINIIQISENIDSIIYSFKKLVTNYFNVNQNVIEISILEGSVKIKTQINSLIINNFVKESKNLAPVNNFLNYLEEISKENNDKSENTFFLKKEKINDKEKEIKIVLEQLEKSVIEEINSREEIKTMIDEIKESVAGKIISDKKMKTILEEMIQLVEKKNLKVEAENNICGKEEVEIVEIIEVETENNICEEKYEYFENDDYDPEIQKPPLYSISSIYDNCNEKCKIENQIKIEIVKKYIYKDNICIIPLELDLVNENYIKIEKYCNDIPENTIKFFLHLTLGLSTFDFAYNLFNKEGGCDKLYILKHNLFNNVKYKKSNLIIDNNQEYLYINCLKIRKHFNNCKENNNSLKTFLKDNRNNSNNIEEVCMSLESDVENNFSESDVENNYSDSDENNFSESDDENNCSDSDENIFSESGGENNFSDSDGENNFSDSDENDFSESDENLDYKKNYRNKKKMRSGLRSNRCRKNKKRLRTKILKPTPIIIEVSEIFYYADNMDYIADKIRLKKNKKIKIYKNPVLNHIFIQKFFIHLILFIHSYKDIEKYNIENFIMNINNKKFLHQNRFFYELNEEEIILSKKIIDINCKHPFHWQNCYNKTKYNGFMPY